LRPDADGRLASEALIKANCDKLGCVGYLASGRTVALVLDTPAFAEDCTRADIIVTPRFAPLGCAAAIVIDREKLKQTGALTLAFAKDGVVQMRAARAADEDRPWSPAPKRGRAPPLVPAAKDGQNQDTSEEPEPNEGADASPLD
jgi:competence protein ComEC